MSLSEMFAGGLDRILKFPEINACFSSPANLNACSKSNACSERKGIGGIAEEFWVCVLP